VSARAKAQRAGMRSIETDGVSLDVAPPAQFSDVAAALRAALAGGPSLPDRGTSSLTNSTGWAGATPTEALDMCERGWAAGVTAAEAGLNALAPDAAPDGGWDLSVAGSFVCVPAYVSGEPECMYQKLPGESPRRVRVITNPWTCAAVPAERMAAYARATAAFIGALMGAGLDVAVTAMYAAKDNGEKTRLAAVPITVKDYGQEADASRLAFACHPAFMRRGMFAYCERTPATPPCLGVNGYGYLLDRPLTAAEVHAAFPDVADERIVILTPIALTRGTWQTDLERFIKLFETEEV